MSISRPDPVFQLASDVFNSFNTEYSLGSHNLNYHSIITALVNSFRKHSDFFEFRTPSYFKGIIVQTKNDNISIRFLETEGGYLIVICDFTEGYSVSNKNRLLLQHMFPPFDRRHNSHSIYGSQKLYNGAVEENNEKIWKIISFICQVYYNSQ